MFAEIPRVHMFGFDFLNAESCEQTAGLLFGWINSGDDPAGGCIRVVITPNVDQIVKYSRPDSAVLLTRFRRSAVVLADGQPLVWLSRAIHRPLAQRLPGSTVFGHLWRALRDSRVAVVVVSPSESVSTRLMLDHPGATAITAPHIAATDSVALDSLAAAIIAAVDSISARAVFIGLGFPKQELLASLVLDDFERRGSRPPVMMLIGGSLEFYLGDKKRAPESWQRLGLEWFHRFLQEPRRLFKRYFVTDVRFVVLAVRELAAARRSR